MMLMQKVGSDINQKSIIRRINKYEVVSFDIFDTLIKRDCTDGSVLFMMMERYLTKQYIQFQGFAEARRKAEQDARKKSSREEVTFKEIYNELRDRYTAEEIEILESSEILFEEKMCRASVHMIDVYQYCLEKGKKIILISDMYLPGSVIKHILAHAGLSRYKKLYLSSELLLTKRTGSIFQYVIEDLHINPHNIIHIGDNLKNDVFTPKRYGMASIGIPRIVYSNMVYNPNSILRAELVTDYRALCSFIDNRRRTNESSSFYQAGYETEGPLLFGFSKWLKSEFDEKRIEKIFFLSREGKIMKKVYETIFGFDSKVKYMYASRRALIVPSLWTCSTLEEMVSTMFFPRYGTISAFVNKMGLHSEKYMNLAQKYKLDMKANYTYEELFKDRKFRQFYDEIKCDIVENSKKEYRILVSYLKQIDFSGKVAVVDIGWHGNMQKALVRICRKANVQADIYGFYLGLNPSVPQLGKMVNVSGYLFQEGLNEKYFSILKNFVSVMEMLFTADHGSVVNFSMDGNCITPVFAPFEYEKNDSYEDFKVIQEIQKGALDFICDVCSEPMFCLNWAPEMVFQNMLLFGNAPQHHLVCSFGDLKMLGDTVIYIAKPDRMRAYIACPVKLMGDLRASAWKIGFLKRLLRIRFPYFELIMSVRKLYHILKK